MWLSIKQYMVQVLPQAEVNHILQLELANGNGQKTGAYSGDREWGYSNRGYIIVLYIFNNNCLIVPATLL